MSNVNVQKQVFRTELNADEKLKLIFDYAAKIADEKSLDNLLQLMADMGKQLIVADRCSLWIYDKGKNELWTKVAHGIPRINISADTGVVGHVVSTQTSYVTKDAYKDPNFNRDVDKRTGYKTRALLAMPLYYSDGSILGVYQAVNKMTETEEFSEEDIYTLKMISTYSEKSLSNAILNEEIEKTQKEVIFLMAEIAESRSKETGNHVKRVAEISALLAKLYGMDDYEVELIRMASPMHDIGKVAIPDSILKKSDSLTDEEFEFMRKHTTIGYNLLKGSNRRILRAASIIAHEHHEKWDGTGYPDRLKGEEIHPYGRISAIADVFDALASIRVYKPAWDYKKIQNLFEREKGKHFDPKMMEVFLDNFDKFVEIIEIYKDIFPT